jgi:hypothetical protein
MRQIVFLSLLLVALLSHCISVPRRSEPPAPPPLEPALPPTPEPVSAPTAAEEPPLPPRPQQRYHVHEVRWSGETLSHIALWYTGSANNWEKIAEANPGLKPKSISIGDRILIPEEFLKVREPMPRGHVQPLAAPRQRAPGTSVQPSKGPTREGLFGPVELLPPSAPPEEPELYGPIEVLQTP